MITFDALVQALSNQTTYPISTKNDYCVINIPNSDYHITIFQDQWDNYERATGRPYYLFHISSDSNNIGDKCSTYFWIKKKDMQIRRIPSAYFRYNQLHYNYNSSTRSPCEFDKIEPVVDIFQSILDKVK